MAINADLHSVLIELRHHFVYLKDEGVTSLHSISNRSDVEVLMHHPVESDPESSSIPMSLDEIKRGIGDCKRCKLHLGRNRIVFGEGSQEPEIVFIGEAPGFDEDRLGLPFVGKAGQLLDRIITAMGLKRSEVYICNVVKCRPPDNRVPEPDEIDACKGFLDHQIELLHPKIIIALGATAATHLLNIKAPMAVLRGKFYDYRGVCLRATYHPAALLRNPEYRKPVWEDVQDVMRYLGRPIPPTS